MTLLALETQLFYIGATALSIFLLLFLITSVWIGYEAKLLCQSAQDQYGGDCVTALTMQLDDPNQSYRARNHAIWALGQFGGSQALPVLQKYYTGNIPEREPLTEVISQYELKKALNLASGSPNLAAIFWRGVVGDSN